MKTTETIVNKTSLLIMLLTFCVLKMLNAQTEMKTYEGGWEAQIKNPTAFNFEMTIESLTENQYRYQISNGETFNYKTVESSSSQNIQLEIGENLTFNGKLNADKTAIRGFIKSGLFIYQLTLNKTDVNKYVGNWDILMNDELKSPTMFLSVEEVNEGQYEVYPFFKDHTFFVTWAMNYQLEGNQISFDDFRTALHFEGTLLKEQIQLAISIGGIPIAKVDFSPSNDDWVMNIKADQEKNNNYTAPTFLDDQIEVGRLEDYGIHQSYLKKMQNSIDAEKLTHVHSVLISKKGELIFEKYFEGYNENVSHDNRSATKSMASAMIGIAIEDELIKDENQSIYDYLPGQYQDTKDEQKAKINLHHLLTMSSGIDAVDFGTDRNSVASEDNYQPTPNWTKTILDAPMINEPGKEANYGSANPYLLGAALNNIVDQPLEFYMDEKLFAPLGISNYKMFGGMTGEPYFGGGWYFTPRDMLKFGQLYLNEGEWNKQQIISKEWINKSTQKYTVLANTDEKNEYGYLWWHKTYNIDNQEFEAVEARGAGGQYICVIKELDAVIVITSGNYRNGRYWQPEKMIEDYILPALSHQKIVGLLMEDGER